MGQFINLILYYYEISLCLDFGIVLDYSITSSMYNYFLSFWIWMPWIVILCELKGLLKINGKQGSLVST